MEDKIDTPETEEDVVDKALGIGMLLFLLLLFGTAFLEQSGVSQGVMRFFPMVLTGFALVGVAWLLWKSPMNPE